MAFVYCNDRWKDNKENNFPGPCQYGGDQENTCQMAQDTASRLLKSMKKARQVRKNMDHDCQTTFKEMIDHKQMRQDQKDKDRQLRNHTRKGKLYRNRSVQIKQNQQMFIQQQTQLKIMIKNALHNQSNVGARNKWGNMRIKEMLNQHRQRQLKRNASVRTYNRQNKTVLIIDNKQKLKQQMKELQSIFTTQRKGCNMNLANLHKRKTPANKFLAHTSSENQLRFSEPSKEDLQVQPSAVYVSDKYSYDPQIFIKRDHSVALATPISSIGASKLMNRQKSIPTGLQDDSFDDDSMEYISDATPGPGSYNIRNEASKISSRIQKFGVTMERFKPQRVPATHALIVPIIPQYKISTNAKQEDVGFGKSTKETKLKSTNTHNGAFYEDYESLEHKSIKTFYKGRKQNVCFDSGIERFPQDGKKMSPIESDDDSLSEEVEQIQEIEEKPTSNFLSKVNRQLQYMATPTENIDFSGQNYNCIANKLKKQKQYLEDYDLKLAPFQTNSKRFINKQVKPKEKQQQLLGIKIQQLKKKKQIKRRTEEKGFTFSKDTKPELADAKIENAPSPVHYEKSPTWIKPSYNIRFN